MSFFPDWHLGALLTAAGHHFREDGPREFFRRSFQRIRSLGQAAGSEPRDEFDHEFGTDTAGVVPLWKLSIDSPFRKHGVRYQAADAESVGFGIESLPIDPADFIFLDLGSGKGRALIVASGYPFRKVIGVEFSEELHRIAVENIRRYKGSQQQCLDVQSLNIDAINYVFNPENTIIFMYNPFGEPVMRRVLDNIRASFSNTNHDLYIIYCNPALRHMLDREASLENIKSDSRVALYRIRN